MGGGKGAKSSGIRSRIIIDTVKVLERVAMERGLNGVDELLVSLGKEGHEVSIKDTFSVLEKECGDDAIMDVVASLYYVPGKDNCTRLLKKYLKHISCRVCRSVGTPTPHNFGLWT